MKVLFVLQELQPQLLTNITCDCHAVGKQLSRDNCQRWVNNEANNPTLTNLTYL